MDTQNKITPESLASAIQSLRRHSVSSLDHLVKAAIYPPVAACWIDGLDAIAALDGRDDLIVFCRSFLSSVGNGSLVRADLAGWLQDCDSYLEKHSDKEIVFFSTLAMIVAGLHDCRNAYDLSIENKPICIINDYVMMALSPTYRACRFEAYNLGATVEAGALSARGEFDPARRKVLLGRNYICPGTDRVLQHYNVNHDLLHIVLFGDAYLNPPKIRSIAKTFVLAEECCVCVDVLIIAELNRFGRELRVREEFRSVEQSPDVSVNHDKLSAAQLAAQDPHLFERMQVALKESAVDLLEHLAIGVHEGSSHRLVLNHDAEAMELVDRWISPSARKMHCEESIRLASSVETKRTDSGSHYQPSQLKRAKNVELLKLSVGGSLYDLKCNEPSIKKRKASLLLLSKRKSSAHH